MRIWPSEPQVACTRDRSARAQAVISDETTDQHRAIGGPADFPHGLLVAREELNLERVSGVDDLDDELTVGSEVVSYRPIELLDAPQLTLRQQQSACPWDRNARCERGSCNA